MVKMASAIKQQKPGKTRGKNDNAEKCIQAATEATAKSHHILAAIKSIIQETNTGKSSRGVREQDNREMPNSSSVDNSTEVEKANKGREHRSKSTNTKGKASLHPGQGRWRNLWQKNEQVRAAYDEPEKKAGMPHQSPGGEKKTRCQGRNANT
jgi:hypothetical protein